MKKETLILILRWIAVLPAAVLASACVFLLLTLLTVFQEASIISTIWESIANGEFILMLEPYSELCETNIIGPVFITLNFVYPAAASAAFVYAGAYTAPRGKNIVSIILATIISLIGIISIIGFIMTNAGFVEYLSTLCSIAGAIIVATYVWKEES